MKKILATLHKLRETRRLAALSRVNAQEAIVAASEAALSHVGTELQHRVQREHEHRAAMGQHAAGGKASIADLEHGRLYARTLRQQTIEAWGKFLDREEAHLAEQDTARSLRNQFNRTDAEVQSVALAEERVMKEARRHAERRDEDTIDDVSLTRYAALRRQTAPR
jgi:hypothetical protein